ncbi:BPSL0067 family protein, partial [Ferrovibrio sp.]|uniref:BPSL0067 family protein n=1 Tax=Ferrovibrio sp. TaxID=1917215 RepID=UPI002601A2C7
QDDLEYLPDPLGRLDMGSYVEKPDDFPDPGWDEVRGDWMDGAPLGQIFGAGLFDLQSGVGAGQANRRGDVFKLQALLHREGALDAAATEGPTGYWGGRDDYALRKFQKDNGLAIDGYALPGGETMETIRGFYTPPASLRIRTMEKRGGYPEPQLRPIGLGSDRPMKPTLLSSDPARNDFSDAVGIRQTQEEVPARPAGEQYAQAAGVATDVAPAKLQAWVSDQKTMAARLQAARDKEGFVYSGDTPEHYKKECVALVQRLVPGIGSSKTWQEGEKVKGAGDPPLEPGTAIATFVNGKYESKDTGNHAAIFLRYGEQGGKPGIYVLDQARTMPAGERFIRFNDKAPSASNNAGAFSVIQRPAKQQPK